MTKLLLIHIILIEKKITNAIGEDFKSTRQTIEADIDKAVEAIKFRWNCDEWYYSFIRQTTSIIAKTDDGSIDQFQTVINATQNLTLNCIMIL